MIMSANNQGQTTLAMLDCTTGKTWSFPDRFLCIPV